MHVTNEGMVSFVSGLELCLALTAQFSLLPTNSTSVKKVKYKEKFDKEMKGKRPEYDLKSSKIYQTLKDANTLASEVCILDDLYIHL